MKCERCGVDDDGFGHTCAVADGSASYQVHINDLHRRFVSIGPKVFSFSSYIDWVNHAQRIWKSHGISSMDTLCLDQKGRVCGWGAHFMVARDEDAFPVDVFMLRP